MAMCRLRRIQRFLTKKRNRRRPGERGAALVEFALISPLLFLILAGIIDFSMVFNNYQAVRQGVREGARQGAVLNWGSSTSCNLTGVSSGTSTDVQTLMCLTKQNIGMNSSKVRVKVMFADANLNTESTSGVSAGMSLIVCAQTQATSLTGMLNPVFSGKFIRSKTAIRFEQASVGVEHDGYETPPSGADWDWCTPSAPSP